MSNRQWTDEALEQAYMLWAYVNEHNLTKTSEDTDIPLRTLQYHKRKAEWDKRYEAETAEVAGFAFAYGLNELRLGISAAAQSLVKDASNSALLHSERLASQKLLFSLLVHSPDSASQVPGHVSLIDARSIHLPPNDVNAVDPSKVNIRAIEANIANANAQQNRRSR